MEVIAFPPKAQCLSALRRCPSPGYTTISAAKLRLSFEICKKIVHFFLHIQDGAPFIGFFSRKESPAGA